MQLTFPEAETPDAQTREKGRLLFARESEFLKGVVAMSGLPYISTKRDSLDEGTQKAVSTMPSGARMRSWRTSCSGWSART